MKLEKKLKKALKSNNENYIHSVFEEIYSEYGKLVYYIISKHVTCKEDVKELTQEVFVNFYNRLEKKQIANIKYYLAVSAKNSALSFIKNKRETQPIENLVVSCNEDTFSEFLDLTEKLKKYISEYEIEIIYKHVIYGFTFKEIAKMQGKPLSTVLSTYNRAVKKLKGGNLNDW